MLSLFLDFSLDKKLETQVTHIKGDGQKLMFTAVAYTIRQK